MQRARGKADYCEMVVMEKMLQASGSGLAHSARLINYDPENPDKLREFDNFDAAFAFDEECRLNGTGGRKAVHLPKPKDTVPKDQLALDMSFAEPSYGLRDHTYEADCKLEKREAGAKVIRSAGNRGQCSFHEQPAS